MSDEVIKSYSFGDFEVDTAHRLLLRNGEAIPLKAKAFDLLLTLVENPGRVLTKDELLNKVWENQFVEENNLTVHVAALRKALGETKRDHRYIVTIPGKGYSFVADVEVPSNTEIIVETHKVERILLEEDLEERGPALNAAASPATSTDVLSRRSPLGRALLLAAIPAVLLLGFLGYWIYMSSGTRAAAATPFQEASFKRLTSSGRASAAALSPDGKYFAYVQTEAEGQSLWVRQVVESRNIQLMPVVAAEYWGLTFSPDGTQIYCTVFTATQADPKLFRVPTLGGAVEDLPNVSCSGITFSPDGKRFAYVVSSSSSGGTLLRTANADGTDDQVITLIKNPSFFVFPGPSLSWSPDGQTIACATKVVDESGDYGAIMGVNVADGKMSPLTTTRFPWVQNVAWLPDDRGLVFSANEDASSPVQIWHQPMGGGEARKLTNDSSWYAWVGTTPDGGQMIAAQETTMSDIWVADASAAIGPPRQIASEIGDYGEIGWTGDEAIVYRSKASGKQNLWTMSADGNDQRQLTTDAMPDKGVAVSPDRRFLVFSSYRTGRYNLWRTNADGSGLMQLTNGPGEVFPRITPDSRSIIFQQGNGEAHSTLAKMPIEGGPAEAVTTTHAIYPSLSPDGKMVAYFYMDTAARPKGEWRIAIMSIDEKTLVRSYVMPDHLIGRVVRWTPDSKAIVYAKSNGSVGNLWRQSIDDSPPVQLTHFEKETIADFAWSGSGRLIAFTRGLETRDIILMSNGK